MTLPRPSAVDLAKRIAEKQKANAAAAVAALPLGQKAKTTPGIDLRVLLLSGSGPSAPKYVSQDVFGYSFLADVFMADYQADGSTWQGFLRPYRDAKEAAGGVSEKVISETAKQDAPRSRRSRPKAAADRIVASY